VPVNTNPKRERGAGFPRLRFGLVWGPLTSPSILKHGKNHLKKQK